MRSMTLDKVARAFVVVIYTAAAVGAAAAVIGMQSQAAGPEWIAVLLGALIGGRALAIACHELGHLAGCLHFGARVQSVSMGIFPFPVRFRAWGVTVNLTYGAPDFVRYQGPGGRRAMMITAAGPAANFLAACVAVAAGGLIPAPVVRALAYGFAIISAAYMVANLVPCTSRHSRLSDGGKLFLGPAIRQGVKELRVLADDPGWRPPYDDAGALVRAAYRTRMPFVPRWQGVATLAQLLQQEGRANDLRRVHGVIGKLWNERGADDRDVALAVNAVESLVLIPADTPKQVADEAAGQLKGVLKHIRDDDVFRAAAEHTLALAYLRQGRFADVEQFCQSGLEDSTSAADRAAVLATVVLARNALGQPHQDLLDEALKLAPDIALVREALAAARPREAGAGDGRGGRHHRAFGENGL